MINIRNLIKLYENEKKKKFPQKLHTLLTNYSHIRQTHAIIIGKLKKTKKKKCCLMMEAGFFFLCGFQIFNDDIS